MHRIPEITVINIYFGTLLRLWRRDVLFRQTQQEGGNEITRKEIEKGKIFQLLRDTVKFHKF